MALRSTPGLSLQPARPGWLWRCKSSFSSPACLEFSALVATEHSAHRVGSHSVLGPLPPLLPWSPKACQKTPLVLAPGLTGSPIWRSLCRCCVPASTAVDAAGTRNSDTVIQ